MTIRLLCGRNIGGIMYPTGAIVTLDAGTEAGLVAQKEASTDLTGGSVYTPPAAPESVDETRSGAAGPVAWWSPSGALGGADGEEITVRKVSASPTLLRLMDNPLAALDIFLPVFAMGTKTKIYAIATIAPGAGSAHAQTYVYDWATGVLTQNATRLGGGADGSVYTNGLTKGPWVSSSGAIFAATRLSADTQPKLYRSTDDMANWTAVADLATALSAPLAYSSSGYELNGMCETRSGVLFAAWYNADLAIGYNAYSKGLLKSLDGGATWVEVMSLSAPIERHIHNVVYDKYRNLVYVMTGDAGDYDYIHVSADDGATWQPLPRTFQCTGVIPTPDRVLLLSDRQSDGTRETNIWTIQGSTVAELQDCEPAIVWDSVADSKLGYDTANSAGFAWWGWYDDETNCVQTQYANTVGTTGVFAQIVGSQDGGVTWSVLASEYGSAPVYAARANCYRPSDFASFDGWFRMAGSATKCYPARVIRSDTPLLVANATGYANGTGTATRPLKAIPTAVRDLKNVAGRYFNAPARYQLVEPYADVAYVTQPGVVVEKAGHDFTGTAVGSLLVNEGFEGGASAPSGWAATTSGAGAVTWNSTTQKKSGAQSAKCVCSAGGDVAQVQKNVLSIVDGDVIGVEFDAYIDLATFTSGRFDLALTQSGFGIRINGGSGGPYATVINSSGVASRQRDGDARTVPLRAWANFKLRFKKHNAGAALVGYGAVELWIDDEKLISAPGGWPTSNRATDTSLAIGVTNMSTITAATVYVDNVKMATGKLPSQASALVLSGRGAVLRA